MKKPNYNPEELLEEIADEVIRLYQESSIHSGWAEPPKHIMDISHRIYELAAKAVGLREQDHVS